MARRPPTSPTPPLSRQVAVRLAPPTGKAVSAEHAALAGTLRSGTSLTPSTEGEDTERYDHGIMFLVKYGEDGIVIDSSLDVSSCLGATWVGILAAEKLTGVENKLARSLASSMQMMRLRTRFDGGVYGPYLIKFTEYTTPEELESILRSMTTERRKELLKGAEI